MQDIIDMKLGLIHFLILKCWLHDVQLLKVLWSNSFYGHSIVIKVTT